MRVLFPVFKNISLTKWRCDIKFMKHSPWKWCLDCAVSQQLLFSALLCCLLISWTAKSMWSFSSSSPSFIPSVLNVASRRLVNVWVRTCGGRTRLSQLHPINLLINLLIASRVTVLGWIHSLCLQVVPVAGKRHTEKLLMPKWLTVLDNWIKWRS